LPLAPAATANPPRIQDDAGAPAQPASKAERSWYGWETLVTDGAALGFFAVAEAVRGDHTAVAIAAVGAFGSYAFGGPAVHIAHGRYGVALGDLGLRVGAPLLFALAAVATTNPASCFTGQFCPSFALVAIGYLGAMAIDSAGLSWSSESGQAAHAKRALERREGVRIAPLVWAAPRGMNAGVGGVF
jgi:hypothetical protein